MKKVERSSDRDTMRPHYDFRGGVRGKYVARYREGTTVVLLDPDIAAVFKDPKGAICPQETEVQDGLLHSRAEYLQ